MPQQWKGYEGQTVNGKFKLQEYLGESGSGAVFLSESASGDRAAIKLVAADSGSSESQLLQWRQTQRLSHPHLIRLFETGTCSLEGSQFLYVVMEYADENLSTILPVRALTPAEVGEMLHPTLDALAYLHSQSLVHGHIKPSNLLAVNDQLKISSDGIVAAGSKPLAVNTRDSYSPPEAGSGNINPSADVWSLGVTLVEALTQKIPSLPGIGERDAIVAALPSPFRGIAESCLHVDPEQRPTIPEIRRLLGSEPTTAPIPAVPAQARSGALRFLAIVAVLLVLLISGVYFLTHRQHDLRSPSEPVVSTSTVTQREEPKARPTQVSAPADAAKAVRVLPEVSRNSLRTVHGTIKVRVRVSIDAAGNVANERLEAGGPSRYFAGKSLEAAKQWKFQPASPNEERHDRVLEFQFRRSGVKVRETPAPQA